MEQIDFTWDGGTLAEQTHNSATHTTWNYQPGTHTPLTQTEHTGPPGQDWYDQRFYAIITDLIGTPTELIDTHGTLAWHQPVTLWGAALDRLANRVTTPLRFPGQYHDPETGLHYNHHRYYDPTTARYTTPDPLGLLPSPNPTTYVPNPTAWIDPLGLMKCEPDDPSANKGELNKQIQEQAAQLGYKQRIPTQKAPFDSHGQPIFSNGKKYITPDVDGHNVTGGWKMFSRKGVRIGTYDKDLNWIKP